jgi:N-acetylmuramoyl-L-alanine amidase
MIIDLPDLQVSNQEFELLARLIYWEARGESFMGQVAVATVVLNRLDDPRYPNTIDKIVKQPYQFTGFPEWLKSEPDWQPRTSRRKRIYLQCRAAALMALEAHKQKLNLLPNICHYFNPTLAWPSWAHKAKRRVLIGNHLFVELSNA